MTSTKTQLPYDYYDVASHCKPSNGTKYKSENLGIIKKNFVFWINKEYFFLGEILRGDRIVNTNFKVAMDTDVRCQTLCKNINIDKEKSATLGKRIRNNYYVHL